MRDHGAGPLPQQIGLLSVVTKSSDKFSFDELRRANQQPRPKREADLVRYDYYASHPEHRSRPQFAIREG
jgi:hypothetical protein